MKTVNIAELKNRLSTYVRFAKNGEEVVIRDRNLPVAKLVPFEAGDATEEELQLVAEGKMKLPERRLTEAELDEIWKTPPTRKLKGRKAIEALLADRDEGL
jgi:prevent-host-death family protein